MTLKTGNQKLLVFITLSAIALGCTPVNVYRSRPTTPRRTLASASAPVVRGDSLLLGGYSRLRGRLSPPLETNKLTSKFGWRNGRFHEGIDLKARNGSKVMASHGGVVAFSGWMTGYGRTVVIKSGRLATLYAHNSKILVKKGSRVRRGLLIAKSGSSGKVTGPHLHFEVRIKDRRDKFVAVNPAYFIAKKSIYAKRYNQQGYRS